jgi:hypothetical protein
MRAALLSVLSGFLFVSCGGSDNPTSPPASAGPKIGDSYSMNTTSIDSATHKVAKNLNYTTTIVDTGLTFGGMNGVVRWVQTGAASPGYSYYAPNGDVMALTYLSVSGTALDSGWAVYPCGSLGTTRGPDWDTVYEGERIAETVTYAYLGTETVSAAGENFATVKLTVNAFLGTGLPGEDPTITITQIDTVWYAPSIQTFVKLSGIQRNTFGALGSGTYYNQAVLTSYSRK